MYEPQQGCILSTASRRAIPRKKLRRHIAYAADVFLFTGDPRN
jgi:hypothetical protein